MAQGLADVVHGDAFGVGNAGEAVAQAMEGERGRAMFADKADEQLGGVVWPHTQGPVLHQTLFLPAQLFAGDDREGVAAVALKNIPAQITLGCGAGESAYHRLLTGPAGGDQGTGRIFVGQQRNFGVVPSLLLYRGRRGQERKAVEAGKEVGGGAGFCPLLLYLPQGGAEAAYAQRELQPEGHDAYHGSGRGVKEGSGGDCGLLQCRGVGSIQSDRSHPRAKALPAGCDCPSGVQ